MKVGPALITAAVIAAIAAAEAHMGEDMVKVNSYYPSNKAPLPKSAFSFLPLGAIKPRGWLKRQLRIQADGLSGGLPKFWKDLGPTSGWLGGDGEAWERGPYYMDGLVPLAFLLEDEELIASAHKWIGWSLEHQSENGWLGPERNTDWWPIGVLLKAMTQYQEATGDPRVIPAMQRFFKYMQEELPNRPLYSWGEMRWADTALSIFWLYDRTGDADLLKLAKLLMEQGYDWASHFLEFQHKEKTTGQFPMWTHVVNNAMAIKTPGVMHKITREPRYRRAAYNAIEVLDKYHGTAAGIFTGDEHLAGKNPSQGTELCAVVEYMFSLEYLIELFGEVAFADRLEKIAFNALPGTFTADMWAHQYDQQANQVICKVSEDRIYTNNGPDANIFGVEPNFGCCTANFHQGWPKFASHLWMATHDDGLAAIAYAPCEVKAKVRGGHEVTIEVETEYPFEEVVRIKVQTPGKASFPLKLRIPEWTRKATVDTAGKKEQARPGTFVTLDREWKNGDVIVLTLPMPLAVERRYHDSVTLTKGPIVFSLKIGEEWRKIRGEEPHADYEVYPTTPWNYGLILDPEHPEKSVEIKRKPLGEYIFSPDGAPIELHVKGRRIPQWQIEHNAAGPLPQSPVASEEPVEDLVLVPYGSAKLRITEFPLLVQAEAVEKELIPVPFTQVKIADRFWAPRIETNRTQTIPHIYRLCKETGRIDGFRRDWQPGKGQSRHIFHDSDVAKWIEAASYSLAAHPDPALDALLDEVIGYIQICQQPDGYLNSYYVNVEPDKRWTNLRDCHELYCAGHLMEAAVAHFMATGKRNLLDVICRYADHIASTFGTEPGKKRGYCGHEEIELALVKLYHATGEKRYLDLAKYFVDERGRQPHYFDVEARARGEDPGDWWAKRYDYCQAHIPVREQTEVTGHAVRAMYLYSGMADLAGECGDGTLLAALERLWKSVCHKRMYITGGIGPSGHNEGFTTEYDLPNESAYAETCAAIGLVLWNHRMLQLDCDGKYADVIERALYNGVLSGISLDGKRFFYTNPLASHGQHKREEWFGCACCPTNIVRLLASVGQYVYSTSEKDAVVHLYVQGEGRMNVGGRQVIIKQQTDYPWDGKVILSLRTDRSGRFGIRLRIPGWCRKAVLTLPDGEKRVVQPAMIVKGYVRVEKQWKTGDRIELDLEMPVERIVANPKVFEDLGRVALQRGPIVYCLEGIDNDVPLDHVLLPANAELEAQFTRNILGGVVVIKGNALVEDLTGWNGALYRPGPIARKSCSITAIPYYAWNNRGRSQMAVWLRQAD